MTPNDFRKLALELPGAVESSHMGHPDFRVGGPIIATLGYPEATRGMVKLTPDEQELFLKIDPGGFVAVPGGWGRAGATHVLLPSAKEGAVREALQVAWRLRASVHGKKPRAKRRRT